ncbi:hypothetical protein RJ639_034009 [Escallonia herrerae]|uniref:Transposase (putative) gypsy type domain-containing protein n=1 Tax=Escallonia herrerae TaxID=1293975 RepID=A0AA88WYI7_9ASTE|nr:hypothetical protein RJ639_034009 [Escallonia herrerae]
MPITALASALWEVSASAPRGKPQPRPRPPWDSVRTEFCPAIVTLLGQSVRTGFYSDRILPGHCHFAQAECSDGILFRRLALCSGRVLGSDSVRLFGTLLGQNARWDFKSITSTTFIVRTTTSFIFSTSPAFNLSTSPSLLAKNVLGDVKDQAEDEANPKPWYTADEKSSKMSTEDLVEILREYPLPVGWYARLPGLQEPANYGTKYETGIYEEQVKFGYRLPLHPFTLRFFKHYYMAPGQLVPNGWRKLVGLIYLVQTSGYKPDATDFIKKWLTGVEKQRKEAFLVFCRKPREKGKKSNQVQSCPCSQEDKEKVSVEEDPIFHPRWTLRSDDVGMPDSQISEQHLVHGVLPRDKEIFQNQTHETFACSFAQAVYTIYASGSKMLSRFEMARQVAAEEAQQKREAVKKAKEAIRRAEELSKQETEYLAHIETLEKRLEWAKRRAGKEVKKAGDQGILNFLDGNAEDEWLKKRADDGLEIYELGFAKAKEMFVERFPNISLDGFVLPAVISPSGETVLPLEAGDAAASHPPGDGPSGDAHTP